jgi:hypothetical protein
MMFMPPPVLSAVPTGAMDMTYDFAPLFLGLVVGLCLCVLAFAFAMGVHDTQWPRREVRNTIEGSAPAPDMPDAA